MQRIVKVWIGLLALLLLAACAAPVAAPGGEQAAGEPASGGVTISFWTRDSNQAQVRSLVDAWNASQSRLRSSRHRST